MWRRYSRRWTFSTSLFPVSLGIGREQFIPPLQLPEHHIEFLLPRLTELAVFGGDLLLISDRHLHNRRKQVGRAACLCIGIHISLFKLYRRRGRISRSRRHNRSWPVRARFLGEIPQTPLAARMIFPKTARPRPCTDHQGSRPTFACGYGKDGSECYLP